MEFNEDGCRVVDVSSCDGDTVFALLNDEQPIYVGRSSKKRDVRLAGSLIGNFSKVAIVQCGGLSIDEKADDLILKYHPKYNKVLHSMMTVEDVRDAARDHVVAVGICGKKDAKRIVVRSVDCIIDKHGVDSQTFNGSVWVRKADVVPIVHRIADDFLVMMSGAKHGR